MVGQFPCGGGAGGVEEQISASAGGEATFTVIWTTGRTLIRLDVCDLQEVLGHLHRLHFAVLNFLPINQRSTPHNDVVQKGFRDVCKCVRNQKQKSLPSKSIRGYTFYIGTQSTITHQ